MSRPVICSVVFVLSLLHWSVAQLHPFLPKNSGPEQPVNTQFPYDVPLPYDVSFVRQVKPIPASPLLQQLFRETREAQSGIGDLQERNDALFRLLLIQCLTNELESIQKTLDLLFESYGRIGNPFEQDKLFGQIALLQSRLKLFEFDKAWETAKIINDRGFRLRTLFGVLDIRLVIDFFPKEYADLAHDDIKELAVMLLERYRSRLNELFEKATNEKNFGVLTEIYARWGDLEMRSGNQDKSLDLFEQGIQAAGQLEKHNAEQAIKDIVTRRSVALVEQGESEKAIRLADSLEQSWQKAYAYAGICFQFLKENKVEEFLSLYPIISGNDKARDPYLGVLAIHCGDKLNARVFLDAIRDWDINRELKNQMFMVAGDAFIKRKEFDDTGLLLHEMESGEQKDALLIQLALTLQENRQFTKALEIAGQIGNGEQQRGVLRNIVLGLLNAGEEETAREVLQQTYAEHEKEMIVLLDRSLEESRQKNNLEIRLSSLAGILGRQLQVFDIFGARKTLFAIRDTASAIPDVASKNQTMLQTIRGFQKFGLHHEAVKELQSLPDEIEKLSGIQRFESLVQLASVQLAVGENEAGKESLRQLALAIDLKEKTAEQILALIEFAGAMLKLNDYQQAMEMIQEAQKRVSRLETAEERSGALLTLCHALFQIENEKNRTENSENAGKDGTNDTTL